MKQRSIDSSFSYWSTSDWAQTWVHFDLLLRGLTTILPDFHITPDTSHPQLIKWLFGKVSHHLWISSPCWNWEDLIQWSTEHYPGSMIMNVNRVHDTHYPHKQYSALLRLIAPSCQDHLSIWVVWSRANAGMIENSARTTHLSRSYINMTN